MITRRKISPFLRSLIIALVAGLAGGSLYVLAADQQVSLERGTVTVKVDSTPIPRTEGGELSLAPIVKRVTPSVVKIVSHEDSREVEVPRGRSPFEGQFPSWMLPPGFEINPRGTLRQPPRDGLGSGVIVSSDGYVVTNNHVVDGADKVTVTLPDGRELEARVVGADSKTDVAVIKVDATDLPAITFADSESVEVGDRVLAVGNPFDIGQTVTTGIVSGKGRSSRELDVLYQDFIQTDAAINPGNSGGPLVDMRGRLIGINTAIYSRSGGFQGIGFAIPSQLVRQVMDSLVKYGKVTRGFLGVLPQDITPALAEQFKLKNSKGVLITDVSEETPAEKAGLKSGDVIVSINGDPVENAGRFRLAVAGTPPGTGVELRIVRDGAEKSVKAIIGEYPTDREVASAGGRGGDDGVLRGVSVANLTQEQRYEFEIPARVKGVIVTGVDPDSAAAAAGLAPGDVVLEVEKTPVRSADDFAKLTEESGDRKTVVLIWSRGVTHFMVVDESRR